VKPELPITITQRIGLTRPDGVKMTGLPNLQAGAKGMAYTDEIPVDLFGNQLANRPLGVDPEGIVVAPDGTFWMVEAFRVKALLTVGETVPLTRDLSRDYRMVGIPDGLGMYKDEQGNVHLFVNHELRNTVASQPFVDSPSVKGAFISHYLLAGDNASVLSGDLAFTRVAVWDGAAWGERHPAGVSSLPATDQQAVGRTEQRVTSDEQPDS
jgi:hypothetical protein